jgi:predicted nucleic acid-binding protein
VILIDTNLLARLTDRAHPHCTVARGALQHLVSQRERIIIVPQCLYEFWAVATRKTGLPPAGQNGLGMSPDQASEVAGLLSAAVHTPS